MSSLAVLKTKITSRCRCGATACAAAHSSVACPWHEFLVSCFPRFLLTGPFRVASGILCCASQFAMLVAGDRGAAAKAAAAASRAISQGTSAEGKGGSSAKPSMVEVGSASGCCHQ